MARKVSRAVRRVQRGKKELLWVTVVLQDTAFGVTSANLPIGLVEPVDWVRGANFEKGAVLMGIRGWYQVAYLVTSTSIQPSWYMSIAKNEEDALSTNNDWTQASTYNSEDVLYTDGGHIAIPTLTPSLGSNLSRQLEVKAKRKLNSDDTIDLNIVTPSTAQDWSMSGVFRSLIALP